ncbi:transposase-like zinc-binding domain-containing protein [Salibacterium aidingense]
MTKGEKLIIPFGKYNGRQRYRCKRCGKTME